MHVDKTLIQFQYNKPPKSVIESRTCQGKELQRHCQNKNVYFCRIMYIKVKYNVHGEIHFTMEFYQVTDRNIISVEIISVG